MSEYIYERPDEPAKIVRDGWNVRIEWDFRQREEIVRCRDCRYFRIGINTDSCGFTDKYAHPNGFCSWGKKKEVDDGHRG